MLDLNHDLPQQTNTKNARQQANEIGANGNTRFACNCLENALTSLTELRLHNVLFHIHGKHGH